MHLLARAARPLRVAALVLSLVLMGSVASPVQAVPSGPSAPAPAPDPIDAYATYRAQSTCDPTVKPGAQYLLDLVRSHYGVGRASPITRACSVGGASEHKEGRAIDWGVNVNNPTEKAAGDHFVGWLTAVGPDGKVGYNARRLGVMYVIWNGRIWSNSSSNAAWRAYTGSSPHTDHVHVSLSWNGAYQRTSWWTGVAVPSEFAITQYVTAVYRDLFQRSPDAEGLRTWTRALNTGTPRVAVANAITASTEYRSGLIRGAYRDFLGRTPDPKGMTDWLSAMAGGLTIQRMEAGFLASPEYFAQAGNDDARWVSRLYNHVLNRQPGPAEVDHWVAALAQGQTRDGVAIGFVLSTERLTTVVDGYYRHLLGRGLDPTGRQTWVGAIQAGGRTEAIIGGIISSDEYFARAERSKR
ncbi:DUF4214 domain-containing protein [Actinotalea sp. K2]|uniref:DUF4214 domain-containing protein n=1 Tax=Actinotalea sp. K2 TaxID=2939438 RepID=UPI002017DDF5|nr:DUF4214 domain-containing protein [Actinotalea sp. K2]MCL3859658.1 DUF4214 domain-containing protein [Actinotalea sp. K2]